MKSFKLDTPKSLTQKVMLRLRRAITEGELGLGEVIPEERLAQSFGVSRGPVREAVRDSHDVARHQFRAHLRAGAGYSVSAS